MEPPDFSVFRTEWSIVRMFCFRCVSAAKELWKNSPIPSRPMPADGDIKVGESQLLAKNQYNTETYQKILNTLSEAAEDNAL